MTARSRGTSRARSTSTPSPTSSMAWISPPTSTLRQTTIRAEISCDRRRAPQRRGEGADRGPLCPAPGRTGLHHHHRGRRVSGRQRRRAAQRGQARVPHRRHPRHGGLHHPLSGRRCRAPGPARHLRRRRVFAGGGEDRQALQVDRDAEHVQLRAGSSQRLRGLATGHDPGAPAAGVRGPRPGDGRRRNALCRGCRA